MCRRRSRWPDCPAATAASSPSTTSASTSSPGRSPGCSAATARARPRSCASWPARSFLQRAASPCSGPAWSRATRCCTGWSSSAKTSATRTTGCRGDSRSGTRCGRLLVLPGLGRRVGRGAGRRLQPGRPGRGDPVRRALRGVGPGGPAAVLRPAARRLPRPSPHRAAVHPPRRGGVPGGGPGLAPAAERRPGVGGGGRGPGRHRPRPGPGAAAEPGTADVAAGRGPRRRPARNRYARNRRAGKDKRMTTWIKVARFHLADRLSYTALPWGVLAINLAIYLAIAAGANKGGSVQIPSANLGAIYLFFFIAGVLSIGRSLPFAFALGGGRRSYYAGTALLAVSLAVVYGLALAVLHVIEQATGGWGVHLHFFRVAYLLAGPWYLTWLTSFVGLALMFIYGMWFGLVYRRWDLTGLLATIAALGIVLAAGVVITSHAHAWPAIGRFFTTVSAAGLTGLLAAHAVVPLAAGYATMRRVTV